MFNSILTKLAQSDTLQGLLGLDWIDPNDDSYHQANDAGAWIFGSDVKVYAGTGNQLGGYPQAVVSWSDTVIDCHTNAGKNYQTHSIQIDVYSHKFGQCVDISNAIVLQLDGIRNETVAGVKFSFLKYESAQQDFEEDDNLHRKILQFTAATFLN